MATCVLSVKNLSKAFKNNISVRRASLEVNSGEIFGLVGPIDSGKSTLMRMVCGLVPPTSGKVEICGKSIITDFENAIRNVGGSLQNSSVYLNMTGIQNLKYYASLYPKITKINERINSLAKFLDLEDDLHKLVKDYPNDKLQKLTIAQALLHYPSLLILDDPTNGLDASSIENMRNFLIKLIKKYNIAVLVASNNLSEMEILCDKIGVISRGEILDIKTSEEIKNGIKLGQKVAFKVNYPNFGAKLIKENYSLNPYAVGSEIILKLPEEEISQISDFLINNNIAVFGVRTIVKTFEEIFIEIINKQFRKSQLR